MTKHDPARVARALEAAERDARQFLLDLLLYGEAEVRVKEPPHWTHYLAEQLEQETA